jgi:hypothetical protein
MSPRHRHRPKDERFVPSDELPSGLRVRAAHDTLQPPASDTLDELLFRFACGDFDRALAAAEALMARVPVLIMPRGELRAEPLGYWHLLVVGRIDGETTLEELLADVPSAEGVRVVCELVERRIVALL